MRETYPVAHGHMAKVWAQCICPVCDDELEHLCDEHEEDDDLGPLHLNTYTCKRCNLMITYVSPRKAKEYHSVAPVDRRYIIERQIP